MALRCISIQGGKPNSRYPAAGTAEIFYMSCKHVYQTQYIYVSWIQW